MLTIKQKSRSKVLGQLHFAMQMVISNVQAFIAQYLANETHYHSIATGGESLYHYLSLMLMFIIALHFLKKDLSKIASDNRWNNVMM